MLSSVQTGHKRMLKTDFRRGNKDKNCIRPISIRIGQAGILIETVQYKFIEIEYAHTSLNKLLKHLKLIQSSKLDQ